MKNTKHFIRKVLQLLFIILVIITIIQVIKVFPLWLNYAYRWTEYFKQSNILIGEVFTLFIIYFIQYLLK